jgi:hypothetical protein
LENVFIEEFIGRHLENILEKDSGILFMIENQHFEDIKIMFKLFKYHDESLNQLKIHIKNYII